MRCLCTFDSARRSGGAASTAELGSKRVSFEKAETEKAVVAAAVDNVAGL